MDQDESMLSTPSSPDDVDGSPVTNPHQDHDIGQSMVRPQTPQNDHLNAAAPGELSPPRSQTNVITSTTTSSNLNGNIDSPPLASVGNTGLGSSVSASTSAALGGGIGPGAGGADGAASQQQDGEWKAGAGWKNKKAQDEMHRAWENFVDRDFSLREFGDVLAHRIGVSPGGRQQQQQQK